MNERYVIIKVDVYFVSNASCRVSWITRASKVPPLTVPLSVNTISPGDISLPVIEFVDDKSVPTRGTRLLVVDDELIEYSDLPSLPLAGEKRFNADMISEAEDRPNDGYLTNAPIFGIEADKELESDASELCACSNERSSINSGDSTLTYGTNL